MVTKSLCSLGYQIIWKKLNFSRVVDWYMILFSCFVVELMAKQAELQRQEEMMRQEIMRQQAMELRFVFV